MKSIDISQLSPSAKQVFKLIEFDDNEKLLYEVRKHWFGLFMIYATGTFIAIILLAVAIGAAMVTDESDLLTGVSLSSLQLPTILICLVLAMLVVGGTSIGAYLYKSNVVLVTSDKIAQVLNQTVFSRKISQLGVGDVQDVTVQQTGIFAHMFNYGTIVVETSGEQANYRFTFSPHPYECAKAIISAHEENLKLYGN